MREGIGAREERGKGREVERGERRVRNNTQGCSLVILLEYQILPRM
jgi:hypothetical protein